MIAALLLVVQAAVPLPPATTPPPVALLPSAAMAGVPPLADWPSLPAYPLPRRATMAEASAYVRAEVEAGRCALAAPLGADGTRIVATAAVLVGPGGVVRRIVPQAIGCSTVEQFTIGYLWSLARSQGALRPPPGWYRATMSYRW